MIYALLFAILFEYLMCLDFSDFMQAWHRNSPEFIYSSRQLQFLDCKVTEDGNVTPGTEGQMVIHDVNTHVSTIDICVQDLPFSAVTGKVYWTNEENPETFSEDRSMEFLLREDQESISIPLNTTVRSLRFSIPLYDQYSYRLRMIVINPHALTYLKHNAFRMSAIRVIVYFLLILIAIGAFLDWKRFQKIAYQYRWGIGIGIIALGTILKLHGSSIGLLTEWLTGADTSKLWLNGRSIRSDEFVAFTQRALSQVNSGFHWFSDVWGYSSTDMFIVYGQPVRNIVSLFRPFSAGYLLLGAEYGLAFYWISRLVICWLVSFEFGRILTRDSKGLSFAYACLIALSPVVQWWFSTNELVEMLIFGQAAIVLFHSFLKINSEHRIRRLAEKGAIILGLVICSGGYILTLYPAWMVPFFYVFLASGIAFVIENRSVIRLRAEDAVLILIGIVILLCSMGYIYHVSGDTIQAVMNTAYPGKRVYQGGPIDNVLHLFRGWSSSLWPFIENGNACEAVDFVSFFPVGVLLSIVILFRDKKRDVWLISLTIAGAFLTIYLLFQMPAIIANVSMMRYSTVRIVNAFGMINLMILFRSICIRQSRLSRGGILLVNGIVAIAVVFSFYHSGSILTPPLRGIILIAAIVVTNLLLKSDQKKFRDLFIMSTVLIGIIGGLLVNPVNSGLGTFFHADVLQVVESIDEDSPGTWAVNGPLAYSNLPAAVGAKAITALAVYPDVKMWETLGLMDEESRKVWDRYAHIEMKISEETRIELKQGDTILLYITTEDLRKLGVDYILSFEELDQDLTLLYHRGNAHIYRLDESL